MSAIPRPNPIEVLMKLTGSILGKILTALLDALLVQWLFNKFLLSIFVPVQLPGLTFGGLSYVQAVALVVMCNCLFKTTSNGCK